jgi:murein DD-endopeptidase MepM/ murein hydrolase activator NlpD
MADCCPPAPRPSSLSGSSGEAQGEENSILPGENADCYARRAGNMTGLQDDATDTPDFKIANTSVPVDGEGSVDVTFTLTNQADLDFSPTWKLTENGTEITSLAGLTFSNTGKLSGTFSSRLGETINIKVLVYDGDDGGDLVDSRSYVLVARTSVSENNSVSFISPLPGGMVNSKYGPRLHPVTKVMKAHTGIDMVVPSGKVVDVVAAADGEVILSGGDPATGYGLRVHVKHTLPNGKHLCTTTYNHLDACYVSTGQKVMAGQVLGKEGSTGVSTGPHLHFECKLPNGTFVDPEPYINGSLKISPGTNPDGSPTDADPAARDSNAKLSADEVVARSAESCKTFGGGYPNDTVGDAYKDPTQGPQPPQDPNSAPADFDTAFSITMKYEVGSFWNASDADVIAGNISTDAQKKKVGYVNDPVDTGGLTKYGVSQNANRQTDVKSINLEAAKSVYYNRYWTAGGCGSLSLKVAAMHFDTCVNHGVSRANSIKASANLSGTDDQQVEQYAAARQKTYNAIVAANPAQARFAKGWSSRVTSITSTIKAL